MEIKRRGERQRVELAPAAIRAAAGSCLAWTVSANM
jgi:hypothetical protein